MRVLQILHMEMARFLLHVLFFSNCFLVSLSYTSSNVTDQLTLLDFMNRITNADSVLANNWTSNTSFCNWIGVTCSPQRRRVMTLSLSSMNLEGRISPSIANLSFLVRLDLSNNSFHGSLPAGLGRLARLRVVDVHSNHLEGNVPSDLFQSRSLETISLGYNKFSGELWRDAWNAPQLRILNLTSNDLTGSVHHSIGNNTKIERLILYGNNIGGEIPGEIGNMSNLMELDFSNNRFTCQIPPSIFNVSSLRGLYLSNNSFSGLFLLDGEYGFLELEAIDLSDNRLTGEIPSTLCRFTQLESLDLARNNLTGQIPRNIGCLLRLKSLNMNKNQIAGTIPPSLGNISSLEFIRFVENSIGGRIPHELGKLSNLQMLGFDFNDVTGEIPPVIFNLSSLVYIAFTNNRLSGHIPATVGLQLPNLEGIYLADNLLVGEIPIAITNASKLMELELSSNFFVGRVPNNLGNLRELLFLNLAYNQLNNEPGKSELGFINSLVECTMLQFLIVGNNPLRGILPDSIQNLSSSIEMFNIENGQVYGQIPGGIGNMSSMISLVLNGNNLTGNIPTQIGYLKELQRIYLSRNMLQGHIPMELCNLVNLGEIMLFENNLSGPIPSCIENLGRLQRLILGYNRLISTLPIGLWHSRYLLFLNVSNNMIQGELSPEIGLLENFEGIDLSSNQLSSVIPSALGELKNLRYLALSNNSFQGSIPASFGNLISLEFLDLSSNNLSGAIPMSLGRLSYLREINVSYNHLEGAIPTGGIFANSSPQSFEGNKDLCGLPSLEVPPCATNRSSSSTKRILKITIPVIVSVALIIISLSFWILHRQKRVKLEDVEPPGIVAHKTISYYELLQATDGFSEANILGVGGSGSVFRGILSDATIVAIKVLNLNDEEAKKRFDAECEVLKQIRHRNLVKVITTCSNDNLRAIVLPYMPNGSLESWLYKHDYFLDFLRRIEILLDVAVAVHYLHHGFDFPVVHCDLKPANVLLDADMVAHVTDFGISKILAENKSTAQTKTLGTIGYIAPEYGSEGTVSAAGDVYSYGIMLMEVLTRRKPTDELFSDNLSLRQWVKRAFPNSLMEVADANLFQEFSGGHNACLISLVELSLDCSKEAAEERINMKDAVVRLNKIKGRFLETKET